MKNIATYSQEVFLDCTKKDFSKEQILKIEEIGLQYVHLGTINKDLFERLNSKKFSDMIYCNGIARELTDFLNEYKKEVNDLYINIDINNISSLFIFIEKKLLLNFKFVFSHEETNKSNQLKFIKLEKFEL